MYLLITDVAVPDVSIALCRFTVPGPPVVVFITIIVSAKTNQFALEAIYDADLGLNVT